MSSWEHMTLFIIFHKRKSEIVVVGEMENWGRLSHLYVTVFLVNFSYSLVTPAIPDITLAAVCPAKDECSAVIYIVAVQQAISGVGAVMMMPLIGSLSDVYGRKSLLMIPLLLSIIPYAILARKRTMNFIYAYYVIKTLTSMVTQSGVMCLAVAYVADIISEAKRVAAFGILNGLMIGALLSGTIASRFFPTTHIFQVSAAVSIVAAMYTMVFLKENTREIDALKQPILENIDEASNKIHLIPKIPSPRLVFRLLSSSTTFSLLAFVAFFNSLAEAAFESFILYYLKARFHFKKDQIADVMLIAYVGATITNTIFMPALGPLIGEQTLLSLALFAGFLNMFIDSIAWTPWVAYANASLCSILFLVAPNLRSIISKQVGPNEQGLAQGCILGITALAYSISPLIYGPLSALVMAEDAPFHFQGFSILCVGLSWLVAFFLSIMIPILSRNKFRNESVVV